MNILLIYHEIEINYFLLENIDPVDYQLLLRNQYKYYPSEDEYKELLTIIGRITENKDYAPDPDYYLNSIWCKFKIDINKPIDKKIDHIIEIGVLL